MILIQYIYPEDIYSNIATKETRIELARRKYGTPEGIEGDKYQHEHMLSEIIAPENARFRSCNI